MILELSPSYAYGMSDVVMHLHQMIYFLAQDSKLTKRCWCQARDVATAAAAGRHHPTAEAAAVRVHVARCCRLRAPAVARNDQPWLPLDDDGLQTSYAGSGTKE